MRFFRRRRVRPGPTWFIVGVQGHRVVLNAPAPGIEQLAGLGDYVEAISRRRPPGPDGRDPIAVLNAKMDHAEAVNDLVVAATLACEELQARDQLGAAETLLPPPPAPAARDLSTYDYIQELHRRAEGRREWLRQVDALLRAHGIALLKPIPPAD